MFLNASAYLCYHRNGYPIVFGYHNPESLFHVSHIRSEYTPNSIESVDTHMHIAFLLQFSWFYFHWPSKIILRKTSTKLFWGKTFLISLSTTTVNRKKNDNCTFHGGNATPNFAVRTVIKTIHIKQNMSCISALKAGRVGTASLKVKFICHNSLLGINALTMHAVRHLFSFHNVLTRKWAIKTKTKKPFFVLLLVFLIWIFCFQLSHFFIK